MTIRYIELCGGIGGMGRAWMKEDAECVFFCEMNKYSRQTWQENMPEGIPVHDDIFTIDPDDIPEHDVLMSGFPCQPFSLAGVSKRNSLGIPTGFKCESQGTIFFEILKIAEACRPRVILLENVKNLATYGKGAVFREIREALEGIGYSFHSRLIDARHFVPQHRERIFMVCWRDDTPFDFNRVRVPSGSKTIDSILLPEDEVHDRYGLTDNLWKYLRDYAKRQRAKGNGFGYGLCQRNETARTLSARYHKDGSEILIPRDGGRNPRKLTPRECSRLMGFDTPKGKRFRIPVSDTQAYRQFGNAVVVPVVRSIVKEIVRCW